MKSDLIVHVIHVAGTQMKKLGIDVLSRGEFLEEFIAVKYHLDMLPLDVGALHRAIRLEKWIRNWWGCQPLVKLYHVGCFAEGKVSEIYLWSPSPAAMDTAMEMIPEASQNRPYVLHIIFFLCLMKNFWRKALKKDSDFIFNTFTWLSVWPNTCHDPLCIAIIVPVISRIHWKGPWVVRGSELSEAFMEILGKGVEVAVRRRPHAPPFEVRELLQILEDPVKWGEGVIFC